MGQQRKQDLVSFVGVHGHPHFHSSVSSDRWSCGDGQEKGKMADRLAKDQAQAGDPEKGAASIMVNLVGRWSPDQVAATGDEWKKAVKVATENYWASPEGDEARQKVRRVVR
jgi:hypothetical protein